VDLGAGLEDFYAFVFLRLEKGLVALEVEVAVGVYPSDAEVLLGHRLRLVLIEMAQVLLGVEVASLLVI
jgi:hypothetical protein